MIGHNGEGVLVCCRQWSHGGIELFGGHVGEGTHRGGGGRGAAGSGINKSRDPKVGQEQIGAVGTIGPGTNEKVGGFDVLVDDAFVMSVLKSIGGLCDEIGDVLQGRIRVLA